MEKQEYQFPPQLGQVNIYFGYTGGQWVVIGLGGVASLYMVMLTMNLITLLPIIMYSLMSFKVSENRSLLILLVRVYTYFIAEPMIYDYSEEKGM